MVSAMAFAPEDYYGSCSNNMGLFSIDGTNFIRYCWSSGANASRICVHEPSRSPADVPGMVHPPGTCCARSGETN